MQLYKIEFPIPSSLPDPIKEIVKCCVKINKKERVKAEHLLAMLKDYYSKID